MCITHAVLRVPDLVDGDGDVKGPAHSPLPARFGFIVSKAVGGAVTRNLVRRRLKGIAQQHLAGGLAGVDIVFRALPASSSASYSELDLEINRALERVDRWVLAQQHAES